MYIGGVGAGVNIRLNQLQVADISAGGAHTMVLLNSIDNEKEEHISANMMPTYLLPGLATASTTRSRRNSYVHNTPPAIQTNYGLKSTDSVNSMNSQSRSVPSPLVLHIDI